jgi:hypothetical protein
MVKSLCKSPFDSPPDKTGKFSILPLMEGVVYMAFPVLALRGF